MVESMKWKLTIIIGCYVIGAGFLAAWLIEADKLANNPPNRVFNLNPIMWIAKTGFVFLFIGSSVLVHLIVNKIPMFLNRPKKSDCD